MIDEEVRDKIDRICEVIDALIVIVEEKAPEAMGILEGLREEMEYI